MWSEIIWRAAVSKEPHHGLAANTSAKTWSRILQHRIEPRVRSMILPSYAPFSYEMLQRPRSLEFSHNHKTKGNLKARATKDGCQARA